jgi:hypothetical protein
LFIAWSVAQSSTATIPSTTNATGNGNRRLLLSLADGLSIPREHIDSSPRGRL